MGFVAAPKLHQKTCQAEKAESIVPVQGHIRFTGLKTKSFGESLIPTCHSSTTSFDQLDDHLVGFTGVIVAT
jgi:hypothetical protein